MNYAGKFDAKHDADGSGHSDGHAHVETVSAHATHVPADAIIVPDAQLLFNGDFKRSGVDLVLSRDDHELVLHDYFKGEKRAALSSPDGAHLTGELVNALTGHTEYAQAGGAAGANAVIGHVTKLAGSATAIRNGVSIILNQGDNVEKGDVVQSGSDSTVGITFIDGTVFGLSSNARMVLNEMVYDPNGSNNSSLISLVAGTISFVAGQTAKHGDMKIDTPVATMGIRGTAVLVEIDFNVSTPGVPDAKFQVLVEPDGTTGSYILFDKNTLTPIAEVNKAGQLIHIREGLVSISNAGLSDEVQKLINEVFAEKYAYDTNPKTFDHQFTDSIIPLPLTPIIRPNGQTITGTAYVQNTADKTGPSGPSGPVNSLSHTDGPPHAVIVNLLGQAISGFQITELAGKTGDSADLDSVSGAVNFVDINPGDAPSVSAKFGSFTYQNAAHQDVTAALNAQQLADIAAVEAKLVLTPNAGNNNVGTTAFSYSVPDSAFDFLAAGETLTLTYDIKVDNNYGPNDESTPLTLTITITGTNDVPVITTSAPSIAFSGGTSVPGGDLPTSDPTSGTLPFTDVDLTDTHTVATALTGAVGVLNGITVLDGVDALPPGPLDLLKTALTASIAAGNDSTLTGNGTINWKLAELPVYIADFLPKGETLTLTYTVTLTDSQGATTTQDVIVTITGTDTPAVVWIATATPGSTGGLWSDGSNWETGTVPTANDDAIIITNQLIGLTPSYPVTIDAPAFAKTVTLNDFSDLGNAHPRLDNDSTLTIGGAFTLGVDSIVDNSGTISAGGAMEVLDASVLNNSGTIDLAQGGDFKDQTSITNAGKIDVTGGTLNILVGVANTGGNLTVEGGAKAALNSAAITGGTVNNSGELDLSGGVVQGGTLSTSGQIEISGTGNVLDGESVTNSGAIEVLGALTMNGGSSIANAGGTVTVGGTLTLNGATITNGTVTNQAGGTIDLNGGSLNDGSLNSYGQINVSGGGNGLYDESVALNNTLEILGGGALTVDGGSIVNSTAMIRLDGGAAGLGTLTVNDATIAGGSILNSGDIDLTGAGVLKNGSLQNSNYIDVSGLGNALDNETVTVGGALVIHSGGALTVDQGSTVTDPYSWEVDGTLTLNHATINTGVVYNDPGGTIDFTGSAVIKNGWLYNIGQTNVSGTGNALHNVNLDNAALEVLAGGALTIDQGSVVANSGGTFTVDGNATLTLNDVTVTSGTVNDSGEIDLTGSAVVKTGTLNSSGTIKVSGSGNALDGESVTNVGVIEVVGALTLDQSTTVANGGGTITIDSTGTLTLNNASISNGTLGNSGLLDATGTSGLHGIAITNASGATLESTGGVLTIDGSNATFNNVGLLEANGGGLDLNTDTLTNTGTLKATDTSVLELTSTTVNNAGGVITVDALSTLDLNGGDSITGGTLGNSGLVDATGTNGLHGIAITNASGATLESTGGVLTIDGSNATFNNVGLLEANGGGLDLNTDTLTNTGTLKATDTSVLELTSTTVNNAGGVITVDALSTLDLNGGDSITGGTLGNSGLVDATGTNGLHGIAITNASGATLESTGGVLTIDGSNATFNNVGLLEANGGGLDLNTDTLTNTGTLKATDTSVLELTSTTVNNAGGVITVDALSTLDLNGGDSITGGTLGNSGLVDATGTNGLHGIAITNASGATLESTGGVLTIDGSNATFNNVGLLEANGGGLDLNTDTLTNTGTLKATDTSVLELTSTTVNNAGGVITVDALSTLDLNGGDSITGGTLGNSGLVDATGTNGLHGIAITNASGATLELTGGVLTIDGSNATFNNVGLLEANGGGLDLNTDTLTNTGTLKATDTSVLELTSTTVNNAGGVITVDALSTLDLNGGDSITGGTLGNSGLVDATGTNGLHGIAITNASGATLESTGGVLTIDGSNATFNNVGLLEANGGGLDLNTDTLTNTGTLKATDTSVLELTSTTVTNTNGTVTVDALSTLDLNGGDSITGGTLNNSGEADASGTNGLHGIAITNSGTLESTGGVLTIDGSNTTFSNTGTLQANGGELDLSNDTLTNSNALKATGGGVLKLISSTVNNFLNLITGAGTVTVGSGSTLDLASATISGGTLGNSGILDSTGTSAITNVGITNSGTLESTGGTLTIDPMAGPTITNSGTLEANGGELDITSDPIGNTGTLQAIDSSTLKLTTLTVTDTGAGTVTVGSGSTLDLASATISGGTLGNSGILDSTGTSAITNVGITNSGTLESTGGTLTIDPMAGPTITNSGTLEANGGELDITSDPIGNTGTLQAIDSSTLKLTTLTVTDTGAGTVTVGSGSTLDLASATISGGTLGNSGILDSTGTSAITNVGITNSGTLESTGGTLTIDPMAGPTITNSGTLEANGGELDITSDPIGNTGTLQAIDSSTLKLTTLTVTDTGAGTVTVGSGSTLDLASATISGGTLGNSGILDSTGTSAITNVGITNSGTLELTGGTLTIDPMAGPTITNSGTLEANGGELDITSDPIGNTGTLQAIDSSTLKLTTLTVTDTGAGTVTVGSGSTLDLASATISGGTLGNSGTLDSTGTSAITNVGITNSGTIEVLSGALKATGGSIAGSGSIQIDGGALFEINESDTQKVVFSGTSAELQIDGTGSVGNTLSFGGNIAGLAATDELDLRTIGYGPNTTGTYVGDASGGTLTITDGTHSISMTLVGDYLNAHFAGATDNNGGTLITLNAADDKPVIAATDLAQTATLTETVGQTGVATSDDSTPASGTIHFTDIDLTDRPTASVTQAASYLAADGTTSLTLTPDQLATIEHGFTISAEAGNTNNGAIDWSYSVADDALDFLAAGETVTVVSTVTVDDHEGGTAATTVTVTITGTNDAPVIAADVSGNAGTGLHTITEQAGLTNAPATVVDTVSGSLAFTDVDLTDTHTVQQALVSAVWTKADGNTASLSDPGALSLVETDSTGSGNGSIAFSYSVADHALDFLAAGETLTVTYDVTVADFSNGVADGTSSTRPVTVTITGTDDAPVIAPADLAQTATLTEVAGQTGVTTPDASTPAGGTIHFSDVDLTDTPTASVTAQTASYLAADGTTALTLTPDQLAAIEHGFTIAAEAGNTNNGAIDWSYGVADNALDFLAAGETVTLVSTVTVNDGHGGTAATPVTVTITGTDDAPVIAPADLAQTATLTEVAGQTGVTTPDASTPAGGTIHFSDVDLTDTPTASVTAQTASYLAADGTTALTLTPDQLAAIEHGFTIAAEAGNTNNGAIDWSYGVADNALDFLAAGETVTLVSTVTVNDGHGGTAATPVTVTITGTDDAPVIAPADLAQTATLTEVAGQTGVTTPDASTPAGGTIHFSDVDLTDTPTASVTAQTASYLAADGTTALTLTPDQLAAIEHGFTIAAEAGNTNNGAIDWSYGVADNALDFLAAGETVTLVSTVTVNDGHGGTAATPVTVTITGTDDAPVIAPADLAQTATLTEVAGQTGVTTPDASTPAGGTIHFSDVDLTDTPTASVTAQTASYLAADGTTALTLTPDQLAAIEHGFTIAAEAGNTNNGAIDWSYGVADNALDFLAAGETVTLVSTVTVNDGHGGTAATPVTVTITGTDDAPVIAPADLAQTATLTEVAGQTGVTTPDASTPAGGTIHFSDVDLTDTPTASVTAQTASYLAADGTTALTLTPDQLAAIEHGFTIAAEAGNTNNGAIDWSYGVADNALDFLAAGETVTLVSTVTVNDGHGGTAATPVTVTITGTDDAPVIAPADLAQTATLTEVAGQTGVTTPDASTPAGGTIHFSDVDLTDTPTASVTAQTASYLAADGTTALTLTPDQLAAIEHGFTIAAEAGNTNNGAIDWSYGVADNALDFLAAGETVTLVSTVTVNDGHGGTAATPVTVTITGTDDAPQISGAPTLVSTDEDTPTTIRGLSVSDVDGGSSVEAITLSVNHGTINFDGQSGTSMTISDTIANLNTALANGVTYTPGSNYSGADDLHLSLNDNSPNGTALTATKDIAITVTPDVLTANDDAISNAAPPSGSSWVFDAADGHYYRYVSTSLNHADAQTAAANDGAYLATITDSAENSFVANLLGSGQVGWTSAVTHSANPNGAGGSDANETFTWTGGPEASTEVTYTNWNPGEPNGGFGSSDAAVQIGNSGTWNDVPTTPNWTAGYVEEWGGLQNQIDFSENTPTTIATSVLLANDTDSLGNLITVTSVGDANHHSADGGTVTLNGNVITYTPASNFSGQDSFTYTISDGAVTSTATVTFNVAAPASAGSAAVTLGPADFNFDGHEMAVGQVATTDVGNTGDGTGVTLVGSVNWNGQGNSGDSQLLFYNGSTSDAGFGVTGKVTATGQLDLQIQTGGIAGIDTGISIGSGQWHNIALTHTNGQFTLYVDGVAQFTTSEDVNTIPGSSFNDYTQIAGATVSGSFDSEGFNGAIADVSVWSTALTQTQIQGMDLNALTGSESGLVAYYPLNDGGGTTIADAVNSAGNLQISTDGTGSGTWMSASANTTLTIAPDDLQHTVFPFIQISDSASTTIDSATVTWNVNGSAAAIAGEGLDVGGNPDGITITYDPNAGGQGVAGYDLTGSASLAAYEDVLSHLTFATPDLASDGTTFTVTVNDGSGDSTSVTSTINVALPSGWEVWTGADSGVDPNTGNLDWNDPGNWSLDRVPGAQDFVYVDANAVITDDLGYNGDQSITQLDVRGGTELDIQNSDTSQSHAFTIAGAPNADGTRVALLNAGTINIQNVSVNGSSSTSVSVDIQGGVQNSGTITVQNVATTTSTVSLEIAGEVQNNGNINVQATSASTASATFAGYVQNSGNILVAAGSTSSSFATAEFSGGVQNTGTISADGYGAALVFDAVTVDNTGGTIETSDSSVIVFDGTTISGGQISGDSSSTIDVGFGSFSGVALTLEDGVTVVDENMTVGSGDTLQVEHGSIGPGVTLDDVIVTNGGTVQVDLNLSPTTLTLTDGTSITGGALTIGSSGIVDVEAGSQGQGDLNGQSYDALLDNVAVTGGGTIEVNVTSDGDAVLTLADGTAVTGDTLHIGDSGEVYVQSGDNGDVTLDHVTVTVDGFGEIELGSPVSSGSTLILDDGTTITGGILSLDDASDTLEIAFGSNDIGATLDHVQVNNYGAIQVGSQVSGDPTLTLEDGTTISGYDTGTLAIGSGDTLDIEAGAINGNGATLNGIAVNATDDTSTINLGSGSTLTLQDTSVHGGTIAFTGTGDTLALDSASDISTATVTGFSSGDTIDFTDITSADDPSFSYNSGVLTLTYFTPDDTEHLTPLQEAITLSGTYRESDFVLVGDQNGGTDVLYQPTATVTVLTSAGLDFQTNPNPLTEMGSGAIQSGAGGSTFTVVDSGSTNEFVFDGYNFTYDGVSGAVTGGTITAIHELAADSVTPIADFTGLFDAASWMAAVKDAAGGDFSELKTLVSPYIFSFVGGPGNDSFGGAGNIENISGGGGNDTLDPGTATGGAHTLTGGAGSDTFVYQAGYGAVTITDFDQGNNPGVFDSSEHDKLELSGFGSDPSFGHDTQGNLLVEFGNGDVLTLVGVQNSSQIPQSDIVTGGGNSGGNGNGGGNNGGPVISNAGNTVTYAGSPLFLDQSVAVTDSTGTVSSVNVWISSGFQTGDELTIDGNVDGQIVNLDGSIIHYHFDPNANNNNNNNIPAGGIFLSNIGTTLATTADFQAALELIQFSSGAADGARTVTWAAYDGSQFSPTATTTIDVGPILNSMTLTVSEGGTTVLTNSDFNVSDPAFTSFTYSVNNVTHGQFELFQGGSWQAATTGGFTTAEIAAREVRFVQNGDDAAPTFTIQADDGPNVSPAITPTVNFSDAPVVTTNNVALVAQSAFGGAGEHQGAAVDFAVGHLYLSYNNGAETQSASDNADIVAFNTASEGATQTFSYAFGDSDFFGVAADASEIYTAGESYGLTTDTNGGKEAKGIFVRFDADGTAGSDPSPALGDTTHIFYPSYSGVEGFQNVIATTQSGNTILYAFGFGQPDGSDDTYVIAEYDSSGTQLATATDPGSLPGGSVINGAADWQGAIWAVGNSHHGTPTYDPTVWDFTYNLSSVTAYEDNIGVFGTFNAVATIGSELYAAGTAYPSGGLSEYVVAEYNSDGSIGWSNTFSDGGADTLSGAVTLNGHLYVVGSETVGSLTEGVLMEIDPSNGSVISTVTYDPAQYNSFTSITSDGHYLYVAGVSGSSISNDQAVLLTYDAGGGSATAIEDTALTLSSLSVSDVAAGTAQIEVTLAAGHGTIVLENSGGLDSVAGDGTGSVELFGTQAAINTALAHGVVYDPTLGFAGSDTLSITAEDQGNNPSHLAESTTQDVSISIAPAALIPDGGDQTLNGPSGETVVFASGNGTLFLNQPSTFTGEIAGISGTGDVLDMHGFSTNTTATTGVGSFDSITDTTTLTVIDHSNNVTETFKLAGDLSGSLWNVTTDNNGGVDIIDPPASGGAAPPVGSAANQVVATAPNQTLTGTGTSNFVFNFPTVGQDIVTNFHPSTDTLQFSSPIFANAQAVLNATLDDGHGNTVIAVDAHDAIVLSGVLKAQLQAADFHFV